MYTEVQYDLNPKTILLWTTIPSYNTRPRYYFFFDGKITFKKYHCPYSDCIVTSNRSLQKSADAIMFHQKYFNPLDLPKSRLINQKWIFYDPESPVRFKVPWYTRNNMFNWTMSYRSDSDVQVKYGEVCQLPPEEWEVKDENYLRNKSGEVLWFVSHCSTANNRNDYVKQLSKYIRVDIYGKCGTLKCGPTQSAKCYEDILKRYKFYLSFENANCKEYVTEKLFNVLNYDILPVVMGSADYEAITPPNSVISAMDFPNPADLAQFLKTVGSNRTLYNSYFEWKGKFKSYLHPWMCNLCKKLHLLAGERTERNDIYKWWYTDADCKKWKSNKFV
ncbi:glycoprotein 3-alpha-L-fucosyltransferase A-like [Centruroides vittatus]|uniref:glycoprotein 3-alpha-L-fucosyltransferase A-like n=1 Tax=Centruroides vittatus TaxID=120091 RepID=UPI00350EA215